MCCPGAEGIHLSGGCEDVLIHYLNLEIVRCIFVSHKDFNCLIWVENSTVIVEFPVHIGLSPTLIFIDGDQSRVILQRLTCRDTESFHELEHRLICRTFLKQPCIEFYILILDSCDIPEDLNVWFVLHVD